MKITFYFLLSVIAFISEAAIKEKSLDESWAEFQANFKKEYKSTEESLSRRLIWESNLKYIDRHNLEYGMGHHTFTLKMNQFGDMTNKEFVIQMNGFNMSLYSSEYKNQVFAIPSDVEIPDSVDWRTQGYVTPIKVPLDQCLSLLILFIFLI